MKHLLAIPLVAVLTISAIGQADIKSADELFVENTKIVAKEQPEITLVIEEPKRAEKSLGVYKLTAYCCENYPHICNNGDASTTATGTVPTPNRTIAVDPNVIPYGSEVIINSHTYIAEDCGDAVKKGNQIDIVFATHEEALRFGVQYAEVYIREKN